jgi:hypothetical protein
MGVFFPIGSGGGGGSYINGTVPTPADLPITIGTPALDAVYLAKAPSGIYFLTRKPAGLYCRTANAGALSDWTYLGAFPEINSDANWRLYNNTTTSKQLAFDLSGISAATTQTLTVPNNSGTLVLTSDFASPPVIGSINQNLGYFTLLNADDLNVDGAATANALTIQGAAVAGQTPNTVLRGGAWFGAADGSIGVGIYKETTGAYGSLEPFINFTGVNEEVSSYNALAFATGSALVFLTTSGKVGINKSQPNEVLDVNGILSGTAFYAYNAYTDGNNNELGFVNWLSNVFRLGTKKGGDGGVARGFELCTDNTARIKIGSAGQIGFFGATAAAQPSAVANATDAASVITQLNALLSRMRTLGLIAT